MVAQPGLESRHRKIAGLIIIQLALPVYEN
jgi:hypothetical protein